MKCEHMNFAAHVQVHRLCARDGMPASDFSADVAVKCADCGLPFRFLCPTTGSFWNLPAKSVSGLELRAPIHPDDGTIPLPPKVRGYALREVK